MTTTLEALQKVSADIVTHPSGFGVGVGIANGLLAEARGLPFNSRSAVITALVIGAGEAALAAELPANQRRPIVEIGLYSALGTLIGLWPFVSSKGSKSLVQQLSGRPALTTG